VGHSVSLLAVSEDTRVCSLIQDFLESEGHRALCVSSVEKAVETLRYDRSWDLVLFDANVRKDPSALFAHAAEQQIPSERFSILVEAGDSGWKAYAQRWNISAILPRPLLRQDIERLLSLCDKPLMPPVSKRVREPLLNTSFVLEELPGQSFFLAASPSMMRLYKEIRILASVDYPVLILGESGVGKEMVARLLHKHHARSKEGFFNINTAAIPSELLESELFGYEAGAFTGAVKAKPGTFELASNGTLLLDEIGEMSMQMQTKLLHVLQDGTFSRLGARSALRTNVRILAATNVNMEQAIEERRFREDLFYRLNTFTVTVPPLRERREEIPLLIEQMTMRGAGSTGLEPFALSGRLMEAAQEYQWPGNIRELRNFVHRLLVLGDEDGALNDLRQKIRSNAPAVAAGRFSSELPRFGNNGGLKGVVSDIKYETEARMIKEALSASGWNRRRAAINLNISYRSLLYKIQQHNITA